jgi:hypothetical protein
MSLCAPNRNVSVNLVVVVRWECVKSPFLGDFQGLSEEGETDSFIVGLHAFHQAVISTAGAAAASAWPRRLFSTTAVWLTRWSLLKTR